MKPKPLKLPGQPKRPPLRLKSSWLALILVVILTAGSGHGLAAEKSTEIDILASGYYQAAKGLTNNEDLRLAVAWRLAYEDEAGRLQAAEADYLREKNRADNLARGRKKQELRLIGGVFGALAGGLLIGGLVGGLAAWSKTK